MDAKRKMLSSWYSRFREEGRPGWSRDFNPKRQRFDRMAARPTAPESGRLLELGCGPGNITLYAVERGFEAYGIDMTPNAIEWAKQNARDAGVNADFRLGSLPDLDSIYPHDYFDVVYDGDCLFMVLGPDRPRCFDAIFRVTKPGGYLRARAHLARLDVMEPRQIKPGRHYDPSTRIVEVDGVPIYQYSLRDEFTAEIEAAGFRVADVEIEEGEPDAHPALAAFMFVDAVKPRQEETISTGTNG